MSKSSNKALGRLARRLLGVLAGLSLMAALPAALPDALAKGPADKPAAQQPAAASAPATAIQASKPGYAIVIKASTYADPAWKAVAQALVEKHGGKVITYEGTVGQSLAELGRQFPRYACFVAPHDQVSAQFVADIHRLTRKLDDDPYTDLFWGILTGFDARNALDIARQNQPLVIRKVAAGTEVALEACQEGRWFCELNKGKSVWKEAGGKPVAKQGPADSTLSLAQTLSEYKADLFVTSGHATERDWQIGFRYKNGYFVSSGGKLFGKDTAGGKFEIVSENPKVYLPIGNCLMGHIDGPDAMALAFMKSAGVHQMMGYTVPTWYGYAGWGCLDYFVEQPGRYTFTEAFFANQHALIHRLDTYFSDLTAANPPQLGGFPELRLLVSPKAKADGLTRQDAAGLWHDRDVVAFYGDPAWNATMAPGPRAWEQTLSRQGDEWVLTLKPNLGDKTFNPVNKNGAQRGGRPIVQFLPIRLTEIKITQGAELNPVITDDFILIPNPGKCDPAKDYTVRFTGKVVVGQ